MSNLFLVATYDLITMPDSSKRPPVTTRTITMPSDGDNGWLPLGGLWVSKSRIGSAGAASKIGTRPMSQPAT